MAEEINLVGSFTDNISPKLKKLDQNLKKISRSFTKTSASIKKFTKQAQRSEKTIGRLNQKVSEGMKRNTKALATSSQSWDRYTKSVKRADRAARSFRPPQPGRAPAPMRGPGRRRGGSGFTGTPAQIPGFGTLTAAGVAAGVALEELRVAANLASSALGTIVGGVTSFQQMETQLAGTFQVLGEMDFASALRATDKSLSEVEAIATALPGSTMDFMSVFAQTFDDQVEIFGGVAAAQRDLEKGDKSFTALFGLAAQIAGIPPMIAANDISQLREAPEQLRSIQIINRNATLRTKYLEELAKNGGDGVKALAAALPQAMLGRHSPFSNGMTCQSLTSFIHPQTSSERFCVWSIPEIRSTNFYNQDQTNSCHRQIA